MSARQLNREVKASMTMRQTASHLAQRLFNSPRVGVSVQ